MRQKIIIGNWKMYKTMKETTDFLTEFEKTINNKKVTCEFGIAASYTNLIALKNKQIKNLIIAAQNCHDQLQGAFTGEISFNMLEELNVSHVIIGHSERRQYFNETDESINKKLKTIFNNTKMIPILCCGETLAEYENQKTQEVIESQIKASLKELTEENVASIIIAYEPIWAIGTGKTASSIQAQSVCLQIRNIIASLYNKDVANKVRIQYGGSVKPDNIASFLKEPDIDGVLVGSASLEVSDFINLLS